MLEANTVPYGPKPLLVRGAPTRCVWVRTAQLVLPLTFLGIPVLFDNIYYAANDD